MKKTFIVLSTLLALASCISKKTATEKPKPAAAVPQTEMEIALARVPGYTAEEFTQGKTLYETHCNTCHGLPHPASEPQGAWEEIVPDMVRKANSKKNANIDPKQQDLILKYTVSLSRK